MQNFVAACARCNRAKGARTDSFFFSSPMVVGGYDAQVAEENGFEIVTHADGSQESVSVTDAAVALLEESDTFLTAD